MAEFTPGPWKALPCVKREGHTIYDHIGVVVANTGTHSAGADEPANANLIAAAPELYAALQLAREMFVANDLYLERTFEKIDEALAKARGETPNGD